MIDNSHKVYQNYSDFGLVLVYHKTVYLDWTSAISEIELYNSVVNCMELDLDLTVQPEHSSAMAGKKCASLSLYEPYLLQLSFYQLSFCGIHIHSLIE